MAAQQSQGIQTLLEAEKEAAKIVAKARTYRTQKLKDARTEAAKEIEELKQSKDKEFEAYQKEHEGSQNNSEAAVDRKTQEALRDIDAAFSKNRDVVVDKMLKRLTTVKAELHKNVEKA